MFGIFASLVFLPRSNFRRFQTMALYTCFKGVFALLLAALTIVFCIFLPLTKSPSSVHGVNTSTVFHIRNIFVQT